jgi:23S rRNA (adenine1618-N6)-methyltransferase
MVGSKRKAPREDAEVGSGSVTGSTPNPACGRPQWPAPGVSADGYFRRLYDAELDFRQLAKQDAAFARV